MGTSILQLDIVVHNEVVVTITIEVDERFLNELGTADEFNKDIKNLISEYIQNMRYKKLYQQ